MNRIVPNKISYPIVALGVLFALGVSVWTANEIFDWGLFESSKNENSIGSVEQGSLLSEPMSAPVSLAVSAEVNIDVPALPVVSTNEAPQEEVVGEEETIKEEVVEESSSSDPVIHKDVSQRVFELINQGRSDLGVPSLSLSTEAMNMAEAHSLDMANQGMLLSHENFEGRLSEFGVPYISGAAENEAYNQENLVNVATKVYEQWSKSEGHKNNMFSNSYTRGGVGVYQIGNTFYITLVVFD